MTVKAKLMMCLMALSVALTGYISCLIASQTHWEGGWISAAAILPGLSFGLVTAGWLLHQGWISRRKAVGLAVGSAVGYFAAYWSAFYIVVLSGKGMVFSQSRLPLFHAGMIAGLVGTAILSASLAAVSANFRRKDWKRLILIGAAAGGALCLAGLGASSNDHAGTLANPGDRVFIFAWQLLVSGYIGMLLLAAPSSSKPVERGRIAHRAARAVSVLLMASVVQAAIGYSRGDKESSVTSPAASNNSNTQPSALAGGEATAWANKYRNAKFITSGEFYKRAGHPQLKIHLGPGVSDHIKNPYDIVGKVATKRGLAVGGGPTQLVVDVQINFSTIEYTEAGAFGRRKTGEHTIFTMPVTVGLGTQGICHRGDKFVALTAYPIFGWATRCGKMGDINPISFDELFRDAVDGLVGAFAELTDAEDADTARAWEAGFWSPAQDVAMHAAFAATTQGQADGPERIFEGVRSFKPAKIHLMDLAGKSFTNGPLQQKWTDELQRAGYQLDSSSGLWIVHDVDILKAALNPITAAIDIFDETSYRTDLSAIKLWERNVVFRVNGELRRANACIWKDAQSTTALPEENDKIAPDLVNRSIESFAKEASYRR